MKNDNIVPHQKPVIVKRVRVERLDKDGNWVEDKLSGILLNPDGRCPKGWPK